MSLKSEKIKMSYNGVGEALQRRITYSSRTEVDRQNIGASNYDNVPSRGYRPK